MRTMYPYAKPPTQRETFLDTESINHLALRAQQGDHTAQQQLVVAFLPRAWRLASAWSRRNHDAVNDLFQAAILGVYKAIEKFDPRKGNFATYAQHWTGWYVQEENLKSRYPVGVRRRRIEEMRLIERTTQRLRQMGEEVTDERIAALTQLSKRVVQFCRLDAQPHLSLDAPLTHDGEEGTYHDVLPEASPSPEEQVIAAAAHAHYRARIKKALSKLNERERYIITVRKLRDDVDVVPTLKELAKELRLSVERVRQVEIAALKKLGKELKKAGL